MKKYILIMIIAIVPGISLGNTIMYVQSSKVKLMDKPSFKGKWLLTLNKGSQINVIEIKDNWVKIEYQSQRGWVSKLLVANNPPAVKASHLEGQEKELRDKSRRRASENTTAAATRGLRSEERSRLSDEHHSDYKALEKVESQNVSEEETRKFHDEGIKQ